MKKALGDCFICANNHRLLSLCNNTIRGNSNYNNNFLNVVEIAFPTDESYLCLTDSVTR